MHLYGLTEAMVSWLVEHGANIDSPNYYSRTPLHKMTSSRGNEVEFYIKLGADVNAVDRDSDTPLHFAAGSSFKPQNVKVLLAHGANPMSKNQAGQTPLEYALSRSINIDIIPLSEIAELLRKFQMAVTDDMKQAVKKIGETFEFYRSDFNREYLPQTEAALARLYALFHVTPVPKRQVFDGIASIKVKAKTWQKQFDELWKMLVPGMAAASTVQGEVIRICGKVSR